MYLDLPDYWGSGANTTCPAQSPFCLLLIVCFLFGFKEMPKGSGLLIFLIWNLKQPQLMVCVFLWFFSYTHAMWDWVDYGSTLMIWSFPSQCHWVICPLLLLRPTFWFLKSLSSLHVTSETPGGTSVFRFMIPPASSTVPHSSQSSSSSGSPHLLELFLKTKLYFVEQF